MEEDHEEEREPPRQDLRQGPGDGPSQPTGPLPPASPDDESDGPLPVSAVPPDTGSGYMVVPTRSELELMLTNAADGNSLAELERAAASLLEVARRQDLAKEHLFEIAEWHLTVKRTLGVLLLQTDARGGDRANSQAKTLLNSGLPRGLDKSLASRCRELARIDSTDWDAYLVSRRSVSRIPSVEGALNFGKSKAHSAVPKRRVRKKTKCLSGDVEVSPQVLDAIERCLGYIDVCVGGALVECRRHVAGAKVTPGDLQGIVLVTARVDPEVWLEKLVELKNSAQCQQAIVLMPAQTGASWFLNSLARTGICVFSKIRMNRPWLHTLDYAVRRSSQPCTIMALW
jgi:hypothetical protein